MANRTEIAQVLAVLATAFPNFKLTPQTPDIYLQLLGDIPGDELKAATLHCCAEAGRAFAPSVGEIRGAVADVRRTVCGVPSSYEAWEEVRRAFLEVGSYGSPDFTHPIIGKVVQVLGWRNLCLSEDQTADRARFIAAYEQLASRAEKDEMMLPQVRGYIQGRKKELPAPAEKIRQLAAGMTMKGPRA